eukprot:6183838-Pleurochrysis_carterae.AAC.3
MSTGQLAESSEMSIRYRARPQAPAQEAGPRGMQKVGQYVCLFTYLHSGYLGGLPSLTRLNSRLKSYSFANSFCCLREGVV